MPFSKIREVTHEIAYELAAQLVDPEVHNGQSATVYSGKHPELGDIHIAIPPLGASLLLPADLSRAMPVVIQGLSL